MLVPDDDGEFAGFGLAGAVGTGCMVTCPDGIVHVLAATSNEPPLSLQSFIACCSGVEPRRTGKMIRSTRMMIMTKKIMYDFFIVVWKQSASLIRFA